MHAKVWGRCVCAHARVENWQVCAQSKGQGLAAWGSHSIVCPVGPQVAKDIAPGRAEIEASACVCGIEDLVDDLIPQGRDLGIDIVLALFLRVWGQTRAHLAIKEVLQPCAKGGICRCHSLLAIQGLLSVDILDTDP